MIKNTITALSLSVLMMISSTTWADKHALKIGHPAPNFTSMDTNGNPVSLSDFKDKIVVLEWTNHDCPFVVKHYGSNNMQTLQKKMTDEGVTWLTIVSSAQGKQGYVDGNMADMLTKSRKASPTKVLLDPNGDLGRLYKAKTTPHMFVIDKSGNLAYKGAIDSIKSANPSDIPKAENYVLQAVNELMDNKSVSTTETKSYGCSVKY